MDKTEWKSAPILIWPFNVTVSFLKSANIKHLTFALPGWETHVAPLIKDPPFKVNTTNLLIWTFMVNIIWSHETAKSPVLRMKCRAARKALWDVRGCELYRSSLWIGRTFTQCYDETGLLVLTLKDAEPELRHSHRHNIAHANESPPSIMSFK